MLPENMNAGVQPMDALLEKCGLKNHDLAAAGAAENLTHKEVARARKGRRLTARTQRRVLNALNACLKSRELPPVEPGAAFNYRGH